MSERKAERGPGGKAREKSRGEEGRGRGTAAAAPPSERRRPSPALLPFTSLASGDRKRVRKTLFPEAAAGGPPPTRVREAGAGTGQGPAAEAPPPPVVASQLLEEGAACGVSWDGRGACDFSIPHDHPRNPEDVGGTARETPPGAVHPSFL